MVMSKGLVIVGAGPIGIEMAVNAVRSGFEVTLLEKGAEVAANVRTWGHVDLFSPWKFNTSKWGLEVLEESHAAMPDPEAFVTGATYVSEYLDVLTAWLRKKKDTFRLLLNSEVQAIGRGRLLRYEDIGGGRRKGTSFRLVVVDTRTGEEFLEEGFTYLIDASGTYNQPAFAGMGGVPAIGERALIKEKRILQHLPNVHEQQERFVGHTTAVIGAGFSAITVIASIKKEAEASKSVAKVVWICRGGMEPYKRIHHDPLPQRDTLAVLGNELSKGNDVSEFFQLQFMSRCSLTSVEKDASGGMTVKLQRQDDVGCTEGGEDVQVDGIHTIVSSCGYKPNDAIWSALQIHQCFASAAPMKLASALLASSGGGGDCLAQASHGPGTMLNPEPGMFVVGMKSYGTGSAFLMKIGHQQIMDVMGLILSSAMSL